MAVPNAPPTLPAKSVSPVKSVERKRKHELPSVWPGRVQHPDRGGVAERQLVAVDDRLRAFAEFADRRDVGAVHHDLGIRKGARDVGGRIAVVGVFVGDEDVAQRERALRRSR